MQPGTAVRRLPCLLNGLRPTLQRGLVVVITEINGKQYVAGMRWIDMHSLNPKKSEFVAVLAEHGKNTKTPNGVSMLSDSKSSSVFGFIDVDENLPKGRFYSLAATLAKDTEDGIYITRIQGEPDLLWMFLAKDSVVSPNTDVFLGEGALRSRCDIILSLMPNLTVFTNEESFASVYATKEWALEEGLEKKKPILIAALGNNGLSPVVLIGGLAALVVLGVAVSMLMDKPAIQNGPTPEEEAALARANYVSSLQGITQNLVPLSSDWVVEALSEIKSRYAVNRYGWSFQGANCEPTSCALIYSSDTGAPRSIESLAASIHKTASEALITDGGDTVQFTLGLTTSTTFETLTEESIHALPLTTGKQTAWMQFVGMAPLRMPQVTPSSDVTIEDYSMMIPPPPDMPGVIKGAVSFKGSDPKDINEVRRMMEPQSMGMNRLVVSFGTSPKQSAAWHMEYVFFGRK